MNESNAYIIGSTVTLSVLVTPVGSATPEDASSVVLDALALAGQHASISSPDFTRVGVGIYTYSLDTTGMAAGKWSWRAKAVTGLGTSLAEDTFNLRAGV